MTDMEKAAPLFEEGVSVAQVCERLGVSRYTGDKLKREWESGGGVVKDAKPERKPRAPRAEVVDAEDEDDAPEAYDVPISVPINRVDDIWASLTVAEKMDALQVVLQDRMDKILNPE